MHRSRSITLFGIVASVASLSTVQLVSEGIPLLPELARVADVPSGIQTWGSLDVLTRAVIAVIGAVIVILSLRPPLEAPISRAAASFVSLAGAALSGFFLFMLVKAASRTVSLEEIFATAFEESLIPGAYAAQTGSGFTMLVIGMLLVTIGGLPGLRSAGATTRA